MKGLALNPTLNDLPEKSRKKLVKLLNQHLANAIDLKLQVKQAHWNVKGHNFFGLHKLFDKIAEELEGKIDEIAERGVALGGIALGTVRISASESTLPEYPLEATGSIEHVKAVAVGLAHFGKKIRESIKECSALCDESSADLMVEISRMVDERLWMVEAHSQEG